MHTRHWLPLLAACTFSLIITYADLQGADYSFNSDATSQYQVNVVNTCATHAGIQFEIEQLVRDEIEINGESFDRFPFTQAVSVGKEGMPDIPVITRMILIPARCGVELKVKNIATRIESNINPAPYVSPENAMQSSIARQNQPIFDLDQPGEDGFWPPRTASIGTPAIMRGYRILPVIIHPLRWNPQK